MTESERILLPLVVMFALIGATFALYGNLGASKLGNKITAAALGVSAAVMLGIIKKFG